jgi:hypothetical protein
VTTGSKGTKERPPLGETPEEVYESAERILAVRHDLRDLVDDAQDDEHRTCAEAMRARFELRLVAEPGAALKEFLDWRRTPWVNVRRAATGEHALRDVRLAIAVELLLSWKEAAAKGDKANANADAYMTTRTLSILKGEQVTSADVRREAETEDALTALEDGGSEFSSGGRQVHAVVIVARITGLGSQTVMRAVRAAKKDQSDPPQ